MAAAVDEQKVTRNSRSVQPHSHEDLDDDSRDSWPSMADTLVATDFSADLYVRRENKRFGWRKCVGLVSIDATTDASRLKIITPVAMSAARVRTATQRTKAQHHIGDTKVVCEWLVSALRVDLAMKRPPLRMSEQSTTGGRPVHRLALTSIDGARGDVFDVGFFGSEETARKERDAWVTELLLAGGTASVELTAHALAPIVADTPLIAAGTSSTGLDYTQRRASAAFSALRRALSVPSPTKEANSVPSLTGNIRASSMDLSQLLPNPLWRHDRDESRSLSVWRGASRVGTTVPVSSPRIHDEKADENDNETKLRQRAATRALRSMTRAAAAIAVVSPKGDCDELRRVASAAVAALATARPALAVTARIVPWIVLAGDDACVATVRALCEARPATCVARAARVALSEELGGAACRTLATKATSCGNVDAARALALVGLSLRSRDRLRSRVQRCKPHVNTFPCDLLCTALPALLTDKFAATAASFCDGVALVVAVARADLRRFRASLSLTNDGLARKIISALHHLKTHLGAEAGESAAGEARLDLLTAVGLAVVDGASELNDLGFKEEVEPITDVDSTDLDETEAEFEDVLDRLVDAEVLRLGLRSDDREGEYDDEFASCDGDNDLHGGVSNRGNDTVRDGVDESRVRENQHTSVTVYEKLFECGGQLGLGLELTAGPWRHGYVAPSVHRTNNATHRRGVTFQDELVEVNGRVVKYILNRTAPHTDVRAAMIAACATVRDAPWPKRLTFIRRATTQESPADLDTEWRSLLAAQPATARRRGDAPARDTVGPAGASRKAALIALASPALVDALFDDKDSLRTRLLACHVAAAIVSDTDASQKAFPSPIRRREALACAAKEIDRGGRLFLTMDDTNAKLEDFVLAPLCAYVALLVATDESNHPSRFHPKAERQPALDLQPTVIDTAYDRVLIAVTNESDSDCPITALIFATLCEAVDVLDSNDADFSTAQMNEKGEEDNVSAWWNDPQKLYDEVSCVVDAPPLGCTVTLCGNDPSSLACRVESVDSTGRAGCAGVRIDDILVRANDRLPPRKVDNEATLVDFFKDLKYPLTLTFARCVAKLDPETGRVNEDPDEGADDEEREGEYHCAVSEAASGSIQARAKLTADGAYGEAKQDGARNPHDAALALCASTLLYSSQQSVAALAARALGAAARHTDGGAREAAHIRVMEVRTATAVAMTPGVVQRLSSWTPNVTHDTPEGLSRDEAASLLPLAETQVSDAVSVADNSPSVVDGSPKVFAVAAARVIGPLYGGSPTSPERYRRDSRDNRWDSASLDNIMPGSALARLLDIATAASPIDDTDFRHDEDLRCTAIDALTSLCGTKDDGHDEMEHYHHPWKARARRACGLAHKPSEYSGPGLGSRAAAACVADSTSTKAIVQALGGSRGGRVAKATILFVLTAASANRAAASAFVHAGVMTPLAWLLRVETSSTKHRRCKLTAREFSSDKRHQQRTTASLRRVWRFVAQNDNESEDVSVDAPTCRELALDAVTVLLDACRNYALDTGNAHSNLSAQPLFASVCKIVHCCAAIIQAGVAGPGLYRSETRRATRCLAVAACANDETRRTLVGPGLEALAALVVSADASVSVLAPFAATILCCVGLDVDLNGDIGDFKSEWLVKDFHSEGARAVVAAAGGVAALIAIAQNFFTLSISEPLLRHAACLILRRAALASSEARTAIIGFVAKTVDGDEVNSRVSFDGACRAAFTDDRDALSLLQACAVCDDAATAAAVIRAVADAISMHCAAGDVAAATVANLVLASSATETFATLLFVSVARSGAAASAALWSVVAVATPRARDAATACLAHVPLLMAVTADFWSSGTARTALSHVLAAVQISPNCARAIAILAAAGFVNLQDSMLKCGVTRALAAGDTGCWSAACAICATTGGGDILAPLAVRLIAKHDPLADDEELKLNRDATSVPDVVGTVAPLAVLSSILENRPAARKDIEGYELDALEERIDGPSRVYVLATFVAFVADTGASRVLHRSRLRAAVVASLLESCNNCAETFTSVAAARLAASYVVDDRTCDTEIRSTALDVQTRTSDSKTVAVVAQTGTALTDDNDEDVHRRKEPVIDEKNNEEEFGTKTADTRAAKKVRIVLASAVAETRKEEDDVENGPDPGESDDNADHRRVVVENMMTTDGELEKIYRWQRVVVSNVDGTSASTTRITQRSTENPRKLVEQAQRVPLRTKIGESHNADLNLQASTPEMSVLEGESGLRSDAELAAAHELRVQARREEQSETVFEKTEDVQVDENAPASASVVVLEKKPVRVLAEREELREFESDREEDGKAVENAEIPISERLMCIQVETSTPPPAYEDIIQAPSETEAHQSEPRGPELSRTFACPLEHQNLRSRTSEVRLF